MPVGGEYLQPDTQRQRQHATNAAGSKAVRSPARDVHLRSFYWRRVQFVGLEPCERQWVSTRRSECENVIRRASAGKRDGAGLQDQLWHPEAVSVHWRPACMPSAAALCARRPSEL